MDGGNGEGVKFQGELLRRSAGLDGRELGWSFQSVQLYSQTSIEILACSGRLRNTWQLLDSLRS